MMNNCKFTPKEASYNFTPDVIAAISAVKYGGTISFEYGEYHFYEACACRSFFAPSNNETGEKIVAFPLIDCKNVTIDGNGSTFVFHGRLSPFIVKNSSDITIKNATLTTHLPSYSLMQIVEKDDEKFVCRFDPTKIPCRASDGNLVFDTETETISTIPDKFSFHSLSRVVIRYLFTKDCKASKEGLAAPYNFCKAIQNGDCIEFHYLDDENSEKCVYDVGEYVSINLEEKRFRDVFFLESSKNTLISDVTIRRGGGMGVIAQLCEDIEISGFVVHPSDDEKITLTADIIHIVNCSGKLSVHDCSFMSSLDDACNVHGTYSEVFNVGDGYIDVMYKHEGHSFLDLYKENDVLRAIDRASLSILSEFCVNKAEFIDKSGMKIRIYCETMPENIQKGCLIESHKRMPDIHIYRNRSENIPHWRLSGQGDIFVENNEYIDCNCPVYAYDLAEYWYESGRINNLVIRNNRFVKARLTDGFVKTGISGHEGDKSFVIHKNITVSDNVFEGLIDKPFDIEGFANVNIKDNIIK